MPAMNDPFDDPAFSMIEMTAAINRLPHVPGQVGASGIFSESEGVPTTTVAIEMLDGKLSLVADSPRGGPGETVIHDKRAMKMVELAHFQREDSVKADEVQGVRAFGSVNMAETIESVRDRKLARHTRDMDATVEHLRVGAIKGVVAAKNRTLVDLYALFGVTAPDAVTWDLASDTTKTRSLVSTLKYEIEDELDATTYEGLHAFCGADFFTKLIENKQVRETYLGTQAAAELRGEAADRFTFGGVTWERYRTGRKAKAANGAADFIASNEARVVVKGVPGLFIERFGPADYLDTVNTIGLPRYAVAPPEKRTMKSLGFEVQTNPIMVCTQPRTLRKIVLP